MTTKILLVDDSAVVRGLLTSILNEEHDMEVVATASDGSIGVKRFEQHQPDLIVLDVEMPTMDGLATLEAIRKIDRAVPIIMFSTLTGRGAATTVAALSKGASDYATKPGQTTSLAASREAVREDLVTKIRALMTRQGRVPAATHQSWTPRSLVATSQMEAVSIASSTGGPAALETVLAAIHPVLDVPIFVVQHMPPFFTAALAERLSRKVATEVVEVDRPMEAKAGVCYIAPGDRHLTVARTSSGSVTTMLSNSPPVNSCRPSADPLFASVAETYGSHVLAVVLTGMGHDGAAGSKELARLDCPLIAQDEQSSVVWGMPRAVVEAGLATHILPLDEIGPKVMSIIRGIR